VPGDFHKDCIVKSAEEVDLNNQFSVCSRIDPSNTSPVDSNKGAPACPHQIRIECKLKD